MSKSSKTSLRNYGKYGTRKKREGHKPLLKPYNFCCDINNCDNETYYDKRKPPFPSSLMALSPIQESPMIKFRVQSIEPVVKEKRKTVKRNSKSKHSNLDDNQCVKTRGPLLWYQEDEIEIAKHQFWFQRQKIYNAEADKNALIGEKKVKKKMVSSMNTAGPRWYQDLSIPQMKQVLALGETMTADYEETITVRTQKALGVIGVTSAFFKIAPQDVKKLQRVTRLEPVQFLREIYRRMTGQYFEEEEYKKTYDCNERIILSAIAFLTLPDAVIELNNRLPHIPEPIFPPKPRPPQSSSTCRGLYKWPYEEPLFQPPDWVKYRKSLDEWREKCKLVPRPRVVLPQLKKRKINDSSHFEDMKTEAVDKGIVTYSRTNSSDFEDLKKGERTELKTNKNEDDVENFKRPFDLTIPTLPGGDKQTFQFSISGLTEQSGPVNYKICGTLKPPFPKRKSWLGEKEAHYIISGISEHEDPPQCPVTYVMTGISYVTPDNSDENFLAELKLGDGQKRVYPSGRKNLSKNWQEWLQDADEEFFEVEREANKLIKSVEATMRLVIPGDRCDACCSCRQTRKSNLKAHATKTPYMVIDSIAESDNRNRYIVGSLAMHSPAPSPAESTVNLLEVVASKETVQKKLVINGITNDSGETTYYISGVTEETQYTPKTTVYKEHPPKALRNVPPCACTIEQMFNEGITPGVSSRDDIPQTKKKGICYGRKYRPNESPPFTCREYPDDKSCRRNPLGNQLKRGMFPKTKGSTDDENDGALKEKQMFTLPAFNPCGDEDGMAVCGGPWGAKNIPNPEIVAAREAEATKILRAPPCGNTPGRAVCGGPWGAKNPSLKVSKAGEEDDEEETEEEEEEGEKEKKLSPRELAKKAKEVEAEEKKLRREQLKRDQFCSERFKDGITDANQSSPTEESPADCGFDTPWNRMRTAPTVNPWENEYEKSLRLTQAVLPSDDCKVVKKVDNDRAESSSKRKRKNDSSNSAEHRANKDGDKIRNNIQGNCKTAKDNVQIIYGGKQEAQSPNSTSSRQLDAKPRGFVTEHVKKRLLSSDNKLKDSAKKTPKGHITSTSRNAAVKNKDRKFEASEKPTTKAKFTQKTNKGRQNKPSIKNESANSRNEESPKKDTQFKKLQIYKQNDVKHKKAEVKAPSSSSARQEPENDKKLKEYKTAPAVIPDSPRLPCQREETLSDKVSDNCGCSDEEKIGVEARGEKEGPKFGWRTKSQQELPREKTLVYLAEPNDPVEMIKVKEGGRPCTCRENRNKKKILVYNIGGAVDVAKSGRGSIRPQLIEGVTYITPPQSPRNSSEYIPEYDLFESPYKMCERKRSDKDLKYISELSTIRSLSPTKRTNAESCPCGYERKDSGDKNLPPKKASASKQGRWSSAMKDEGLIDYFVSCQDTVPCWLRCAKYSKAGCCEKPKLLQVKKPVCECRYERRVVRREEEKKKWIDRQQRLKGCKKQPYLQVSETSRPMVQDTKLMISSVKKVLRDGEFIPETQYCVTGIAENYAMGPAQYVTPGITMQSPVITPEPSKPDILCMCGHRHWSPTDITAGNAAELSKSVRAKGEYPCRGREQKTEITEKTVPNNGETTRADDSETYEAYHSCADAGGSCSTGFDESRQLVDTKKRKLVSSVLKVDDNAKRNSKKLKFVAEKVSRDSNKKRNSESTEGGDGPNVNELRQSMTSRTEGSKSPMKQRQQFEHDTPSSRNGTPVNVKHVFLDNSPQHILGPGNAPDLFGLMKIELEKMASEDFVLAKLPECWLIPQLRSWIDYREGKIYTNSMRKELCDLSMKRWGMMQQTKKPSIPLPSLNLKPAEIARMTFDRVDEMKAKIPALQAKYYSELRKMRVSEARLYWPTMEFGRFPNLSFKEAYFTYMAGKEADGHVFRPWKIEDSK